MNAKLLERQVALAGVALLATLGTLALDRNDSRGAAGAPAQEPPPAETWYEATAGAYGPGMFGRTTSCGVKLTRETRGVAHPELPCGVKIVVSFRGREVETQVLERRPLAGGHDFDLTQALAQELGLAGVQLVRWRFALEPR